MSVVLAWLVGVIDVAQFLPQVRRTMALHRIPGAIRGLSPWTWTIATIQGTAWIIYGFGTHHLAVGIPNLVITPICAVILLLVVVARRTDTKPLGPSGPEALA